MKVDVRWQGDEQLQVGLRQYNQRLLAGLFSIAQFYAPQMEAYAKQNREWTDRTSNARQGLHTQIDDQRPRYIRIYLSHGVVYGEDLETVSSGAFAILMPTINHFAPKIMKKIRDFLAGRT